MPNIFIAVPHYDQIIPQALHGLILSTTMHQYSLNLEGGSLLALIFNRLWIRALNRRNNQPHPITHFAMHHSDVEAQPGWCDILIEEMRVHNADLVSVVLPIKDKRGLTSTGKLHLPTGKITRLTMTEVDHLPGTFDHTDGSVDQALLINTGLWICDFTKPWVEEVCFHIRDAITKEDDGTFQARAIPEDWNFSEWCKRKGLNVRATRLVKAVHHGRAGYPNDEVWGTYQTDNGDPVTQ
jgi:hypothetical protein